LNAKNTLFFYLVKNKFNNFSAKFFLGQYIVKSVNEIKIYLKFNFIDNKNTTNKTNT